MSFAAIGRFGRVVARHKRPTVRVSGAGYNVAVLFLLCLLGCTKPVPVDPGPEHTLAFGGDTFFGRRVNRALSTEQGRSWIFGDVASKLQAADIAVINGEGVISVGGEVANKGERRPFAFRARPEMVDVLLNAGIDVVFTGNNHAGDYGPLALREQLQRLTAAGIEYAGAGLDEIDANRAAYVAVDDLVVAFVGVDLTGTVRFRATANTAGIVAYNAEEGAQRGAILAWAKDRFKEAKARADVVFFAPHWGANMAAAPTADRRELAASILDIGFDGILGSSAHVLQGVEKIKGKPVIYDAGNLLTDTIETDEQVHQAALFRLGFNRAGVSRVTIDPLWLGMAEVRTARGGEVERILSMYAKKSLALNTELRREGDSLVLDCEPGVAVAAALEIVQPRSVPSMIEEAPNRLTVDVLPAEATPVDVRFDNGVRLVGYSTPMEALPPPRTSAAFTLYFQAETTIPDDWTVRWRLDPIPPGTIPLDHDEHDPGDYAFPSSTWPVGPLIVDDALVRIGLDPEGEVRFSVGLIGPTMATIMQSDVPVVDRRYATLSTLPWREGAPDVFQARDAKRKEKAP